MGTDVRKLYRRMPSALLGVVEANAMLRAGLETG